MNSSSLRPRRFLIQILPAAVVAPLFFRGEIEFGVINQSSSAFNHILTDVSLVVYQVKRSCLPPGARILAAHGYGTSAPGRPVSSHSPHTCRS